MTLGEHIYDVIVRTVKTALAVYTAFLLGGGLNVVHVSGSVQAKVTYLASLATALLNSGIKINSAISPQSTPLQVQPPPVVPPEPPVV